MKRFDFVIIGAGIFGLSTAIELCQKKYTVAVLNPDQIPHPLAASTDISKVVRMEYGTDVEYMEMAIECLKHWRRWNDLLDETIFYETGFLLTTASPIKKDTQSFESASFSNLIKKGYSPERLNTNSIAEKFPAFEKAGYGDGFYHKEGGYARSGRVLELLAQHAKNIGVEIYENQTAKELHPENGQIEKIKTREGSEFLGKEIIVCAGNFTYCLVPDLKPYFKVTGHPVFHIKPSQPTLFNPEIFPVFAADISNTGWYGFPIHPKEQVVKIARHGTGQELHPEFDERKVSKEEEKSLRQFLKETIPNLADDPIVYTRKCCYTDTLDGHFWIDKHPTIKNLTVGSGGSGHGFKMGPIIGKMIAAKALGESYQWSKRYNWRQLSQDTIQQEEARSKV